MAQHIGSPASISHNVLCSLDALDRLDVSCCCGTIHLQLNMKPDNPNGMFHKDNKQIKQMLVGHGV